MEKILKWLVFEYSFLSLTFDFFLLLFGVSLGVHTFYKYSTKNLEAKTICFFEPLHCLVCQILHQSPDKRSQENMPFQAQTYRYIFICIFGILMLERWLIPHFKAKTVFYSNKPEKIRQK